MVKVLFICMGNICRSPTAEGVFRKVVTDAGLDHLIHISSAGTHRYHKGKAPDQRAQRAALQRGVDISLLRAKQVIRANIESYDYILPMDADNYRYLQEICPSGHEHKIRLFLEFAPHLNISEVPDPYYGGQLGFEKVLDMVEEAAQGLLKHLTEQQPHLR